VLAAGDVLEALHGVRWPHERPVSGGSPGTHRARTRGSSAEFAEYRSYRQGEDVRRLDWKVLARTDRAYIRLAEDHALLPTTIVVDASASMAFPADTNGKWIHAARLAAGLAAVAHATGDPVGLAITGGRVLPPRMRQGVVSDITRALAAAAPGGTASVAASLTAAYGRVAIVSDFLAGAGPVAALARAARTRGALVYAVHIVDAAELDPPHGAAIVADPEAPDLQRPLTPATRTAYLANFARWRAELADDLHGAGAHYALTVSGPGGEPAARAVRRIVRGWPEPGAHRPSAPIP
jgi:uncharacterized protein (DUF58 family)